MESKKFCKCGHEQAAHVNFGYACQIDYNADDCLRFEDITGGQSGVGDQTNKVQ